MNFLEIAKSGDISSWAASLAEGNDPNELDTYGTIPLSWLVKLDHLDLFIFALEKGADPFFPYRMGGSVFFDLLSQNKTKFIEAFLSTKSSWENSSHYLTRDKEGNTVFHTTLKVGNEDVWEALSSLIKISDWELRNEEGRTIFLEAVATANIGYLSSVLDLYPEMIKQTDREGKTALHIAAERNLSDDVEFLMGVGLPLEEKDMLGNTALFLAAGADAIESLELLLGHGADLFVYGENGESITRLLDRQKLHHAFKCWKKELFRRLKQIDFVTEKDQLAVYLAYLEKEKPLNDSEIAQAKLLDYL